MGVERLDQRDISGVIGRQIVSQIPNARQEKVVRVSLQREVREVGERHAAVVAVDFASRGITSDHLCDLYVEQMGA
jgi:hypothetical protein